MPIPKLADKRQKKGKLSYGLTVVCFAFVQIFLLTIRIKNQARIIIKKPEPIIRLCESVDQRHTVCEFAQTP